MKRVILASPRGFCAGVERAVASVELALARFGPPVYVRRQIVHNNHVVAALRAQGAIFVQEVDEVPAGAVLIFSAHGVSPAVRAQAHDKGLRVVDATCPLVTKVHREAQRLADQGYSILLIGQPGHDEVVGTAGHAPDNITVVDPRDPVLPEQSSKTAWLSQTTLAADETKEVVERIKVRMPLILDPPSDDICYAAQNRQQAVAAVAERAELVLVVGSSASHNSRMLVEVAARRGTPAFLIEDATLIDPRWLVDVEVIGVSGGASAPERLVRQVLDSLSERGFTQVEELRLADERQLFAMPRELGR